MRLKITNKIAISETRSKQECLLCLEEVKTGVIIYSDSKFYNYRVWLHINCLLHKKSSVVTGYPIDTTCSFCEEKIGDSFKSTVFHFCSFHPKCYEDLKSKVAELQKVNPALFTALNI